VNKRSTAVSRFNIGAGVDALLKLRLPPGVAVVRLDDAGMAVQMAEYVCHAVIRHFRELDRYDEAAAQAQWAFRKPRQRQDFPVGVLGLGVLGQRVAKALAQFEFPVHGWSRGPREVPGVRCYHGSQGLPAFLAASRVLVNLLPLTPETRDLLNRATLSQLQPGGYVVNVARGAHLVDEDLLALLGACRTWGVESENEPQRGQFSPYLQPHSGAMGPKDGGKWTAAAHLQPTIPKSDRLLDSGHLAGATLDVFRTEPLPSDHPFWRHPRITVTPHTAARTLRDESIAQIARKIRALQQGEPIAGVVDVQRGY
jgi:glyoxylate/hydroxypyruvate reductase A